jgi:hypothetical protein
MEKNSTQRRPLQDLEEEAWQEAERRVNTFARGLFWRLIDSEARRRREADPDLWPGEIGERKPARSSD